MSTLALPRTSGCLACGRDNPLGLHLHLSVDEANGGVTTEFTVRTHHAGFADVAHGGLIATISDEAMAWTAAWAAGRFGLCGELVNRFRAPARVGMTLSFRTSVVSVRSRLIETAYECIDASGSILSTGTAKYVPMPPAANAEVIATFLDEPGTREAAARFAAR